MNHKHYTRIAAEQHKEKTKEEKRIHKEAILLGEEQLIKVNIFNVSKSCPCA
jgi:hypothetical protein